MKSSVIDLRAPGSWAILLAFLLAVIGVGALIGINNTPDTWYAALAKPPFNPPNWVFAPIWFTLYVLIAIAGWRSFMRAGFSGAGALWTLQMVLNWSWSPTWFTLHLLWPAFAIIVAIFALIIGFILASWRSGDRISAWLFVPYGLWVAFASALNLSIALLN